MPTAHDFAAAAESFAGVRWRRHGRTHAGLDCGGLLIASLATVGITIDATRDYDAGMPACDLLWRLCRAHGDEVPWTERGEGLVGLCSWNGTEPRHLVVMLAGDRIAHVDASARRVTVVPASWLESRLLAVFRVRGITYGDLWQP